MLYCCLVVLLLLALGQVGLDDYLGEHQSDKSHTCVDSLCE